MEDDIKFVAGQPQGDKWQLGIEKPDGDRIYFPLLYSSKDDCRFAYFGLRQQPFRGTCPEKTASTLSFLVYEVTIPGESQLKWQWLLQDQTSRHCDDLPADIAVSDLYDDREECLESIQRFRAYVGAAVVQLWDASDETLSFVLQRVRQSLPPETD
jgi:hypothetical protein